MEQLVSEILFGVFLFTGTAVFFERLDAVLSVEAKTRLTNWLQDVKPTHRVLWPARFVEVFDRVFTRRHLSWQCFFRSCAMSCLLVAMFTIGLYCFLDLPWGGVPTLGGFTNAPSTLVLFTILLNLPIDYLSLVETRIALKWMTQSKKVYHILFLLAADIGVTLMLFIVGEAISRGMVLRTAFYFFDSFWVSGPGYYTMFYRNDSFIELVGEWMLFRNYASVLFWTTFFSSGWLWLFAVSGLLIRFGAIRRLTSFFSFFKRQLNVVERPMYSLGVVAGSVSAAVWWLVSILGIGIGFALTNRPPTHLLALFPSEPLSTITVRGRQPVGTIGFRGCAIDRTREKTVCEFVLIPFEEAVWNRSTRKSVKITDDTGRVFPNDGNCMLNGKSEDWTCLGPVHAIPHQPIRWVAFFDGVPSDLAELRVSSAFPSWPFVFDDVKVVNPITPQVRIRE